MVSVSITNMKGMSKINSVILSLLTFVFCLLVAWVLDMWVVMMFPFVHLLTGVALEYMEYRKLVKEIEDELKKEE